MRYRRGGSIGVVVAEAGADLVDQFFSYHYYYNQTEWSNSRADCAATPTT